jgi:hypothetical protein
VLLIHLLILISIPLPLNSNSRPDIISIFNL